MPHRSPLSRPSARIYSFTRPDWPNSPTSCTTMPIASLASSAMPTAPRSLGDKLQTLALTRPIALQLVEAYLDRLLVGADEELPSP